MQAFFFFLMIPHEPGCVQKSCLCHFPSSAATVTWQPSTASIHCDRETLCLHTEFNHSSPHLHCRDGSEDGGKGRVYGGNDGKRLGGRRQKGADVKLCERANGALEQEGK